MGLSRGIVTLSLVFFNQKNVLPENESDADRRQKQSHALHSPTVDSSYIDLLGEAYWSQT